MSPNLAAMMQSMPGMSMGQQMPTGPAPQGVPPLSENAAMPGSDGSGGMSNLLQILEDPQAGQLLQLLMQQTGLNRGLQQTGAPQPPLLQALMGQQAGPNYAQGGQLPQSPAMMQSGY